MKEYLRGPLGNSTTILDFSVCACVCVRLLAVQKAHLRGLGKGEDSLVTQIQHDTFLDRAGVCVRLLVINSQRGESWP